MKDERERGELGMGTRESGLVMENREWILVRGGAERKEKDGIKN